MNTEHRRTELKSKGIKHKSIIGFELDGFLYAGIVDLYAFTVVTKEFRTGLSMVNIIRDSKGLKFKA